MSTLSPRVSVVPRRQSVTISVVTGHRIPSCSANTVTELRDQPQPQRTAALKHELFQLKKIIFGSWLNLLLLLFPFGMAAKGANWSATAIFLLNFATIIPMSKLLGVATESLALHTNESIGGLLNATFGNAVELIISIMALNEGLLRVVQVSLLGSILSNLLLVLGFCFFMGGLRYKEQQFNATAAQTGASLLALSVMALLVPAAFVASTQIPADDYLIVKLSRATALVLLGIYILYLIFQLKTHAYLYVDGPKNAPDATHGDVESLVHQTEENVGEHHDEEEDDVELSLPGSIILLISVTLAISFSAEALVGSIEEVARTMGLSETFIGIILLPIVGNAAEHVTAVTMALKNKCNIVLGVALGSSMQIALFVVPFLVLLAWSMGIPLTLYFHQFETAVLFISVLIVNYLISDGSSNWLEGMMLLATYVVVSIAFFYLPDEKV